MALRNCPRCGNRFSSRLTACPDCGLNPETTDLEKLKKTALRAFRVRIYHLKMASYVALTLIMAGFIWYYFKSDQFMFSAGNGPWVIMGAGVFAYVVIRALMLQCKLQYRKKWR